MLFLPDQLIKSDSALQNNFLCLFAYENFISKCKNKIFFNQSISIPEYLNHIVQCSQT